MAELVWSSSGLDKIEEQVLRIFAHTERLLELLEKVAAALHEIEAAYQDTGVIANIPARSDGVMSY